MTPPVCKSMRSNRNAYITPPNARKTSVNNFNYSYSNILMAPKANRGNRTPLVRDTELPYSPLFADSDDSVVVSSMNIGMKTPPKTTTPEPSVTSTAPSTPESDSERMPNHHIDWAPERPSASRRLGLNGSENLNPQASEHSDSDAPSTPLRPTQAARRYEMLLRAPKAPTRMAPARYAYERSLGGNRHTNNVTPKKTRRSVDLEIYTPERNRRAQLEQIRACYKRV